MKTDFDKIVEVLKNQEPRGVKSGNWSKCSKLDIVESGEGGRTIRVKNLYIGFCFNSEKRFIGIYNW